MVITLCLMVVTIGVLILEINATHLVNPTWSPHARLHEAWQLLTNSALGILALVWTWRKNNLGHACLFGTLVTGAFLLAWILRSAYGGSMAGTTSAANTIAGFDSAVIIMGGAWLILVVSGCRVWLIGHPDTGTQGVSTTTRGAR